MMTDSLTLVRRTSYVLSIIAIGYTAWYLHFGKPWMNDGAISVIGLAHRGLFAVWGALVLAALSLSVITAYKTFHKTWLYIPMLAVCAVGMGLTVSCRFQYIHHTEYLLHCIGSLVFSVTMSVTVFLLFLLGWKKHILFKIFTALTTVITLVALTLLCTVQETGLIEAIPIASGLVMLTIINIGGERLDTARTAAAAEQLPVPHAGAQAQSRFRDNRQ